MAHPVDELLDVVHQRVRLGILAILNEVGKAEFGYLRNALDLTDGNLARHLQVLKEAGLVRSRKISGTKSPRTWVSVTAAGRRAYKAEIETLRALIDPKKAAQEHRGKATAYEIS